eukprot:g72502.t1
MLTLEEYLITCPDDVAKNHSFMLPFQPLASTEYWNYVSVNVVGNKPSTPETSNEQANSCSHKEFFFSESWYSDLIEIEKLFVIDFQAAADLESDAVLQISEPQSHQSNHMHAHSEVPKWHFDVHKQSSQQVCAADLRRNSSLSAAIESIQDHAASFRADLCMRCNHHLTLQSTPDLVCCILQQSADVAYCFNVLTNSFACTNEQCQRLNQWSGAELAIVRYKNTVITMESVHDYLLQFHRLGQVCAEICDMFLEISAEICGILRFEKRSPSARSHTSALKQNFIRTDCIGITMLDAPMASTYLTLFDYLKWANSQAAEQGNSALKKIKSQVSYMTQKHMHISVNLFFSLERERIIKTLK